MNWKRGDLFKLKLHFLRQGNFYFFCATDETLLFLKMEQISREVFFEKRKLMILWSEHEESVLKICVVDIQQ